MTSSNNPIPLFFWSSVRFENKSMENYGDLLSKYIVEKVSGREVRFYNAPRKRRSFFKKKYLMAIGSIMKSATDRSVVWGSGIISRGDQFGAAEFTAVRGPKSRERVVELGYDCPEIYGDPGILLPRYYKPEVNKTHKLGIIPHYIDHKIVQEMYKDDPNIKVIDLITNDLEKTTLEILSCEQTISSSLHGLIISHAYAIPSVWVKYSDKLSGDNVKFEDYFLSVGIEPYEALCLENRISGVELLKIIENNRNLPEQHRITKMQDELINAFPQL